MSWLTIRDREGCISVREMRSLFEECIRDTKKLSDTTPLGVMEVNGEFSHYMDPDTDTMWLGFAIGLRCAERLARSDAGATA